MWSVAFAAGHVDRQPEYESDRGALGSKPNDAFCVGGEGLARNSFDRGRKLSMGIAGCHADRLGSQIEPDQSAASGQMQSSLIEWQDDGHLSRHRAWRWPFGKIRNLAGVGEPHAIACSA